MELTLSPLGHTWLLDLDGTILRHNGYKDGEGDSVLPGAMDFLGSIPEGDMVVFVTSREEGLRDATLGFLDECGIRYDHVLFGAPYGERVLVNDRKPGGLETAVAVNVGRDDFPNIQVEIDHTL